MGRITKTENLKPRRAWNETRERVFIAALADVPHVKRAAKLADLCVNMAYRRRADDSDFKAMWDAALAQGWDRLDSAMLARAIEAIESSGEEGEAAIGPMSFKDAITVRNLYAARRGRATAAPTQADSEAACQAILRRIAAIERGRGGGQ